MKGLSIVAKKLGISSEVAQGYRTLSNISEHGGQEVPHLHFHIFADKKFEGWLINDFESKKIFFRNQRFFKNS